METRNLVIIRVYILAKSDPWNFMQRQTVRRVNYTNEHTYFTYCTPMLSY